MTDVIRTRRGWVSGYYELRFVLRSGPSAGRGSETYVIVRAAPKRHAKVLVQVPVNTWQAYNQWGGRSLYAEHGLPAGYRVSFDRPYADPHQLPRQWELQLVRFVERRGYDVSYQTDLDTDADPGSLLQHRLVMTAGHDEYWTKGIRDAFEAARDAGVNLAFMGANVGYWQMRYEDGGQTIVEYREKLLDPEPDEALKTARFWRLQPPRPECTLRGVGWLDGVGRSHTYVPVPQSLSDPWFAGAGFTENSTLNGLVGYEWDYVQPGCNVPTPKVLFDWEGTPSNADAARYTASSGATVFSSGSLQFTWGLDRLGGHKPDVRLQRFMVNALRDLLKRPHVARASGNASLRDGHLRE